MSKLSVLSANEKAALGFSHRFLITLADIAAVGDVTAYAFPIMTGKTRLLCRGVVINVKTAAANAQTVTLSVGDTNSATSVCAAKDVKQAAGFGYFDWTGIIWNTAYNLVATLTVGSGHVHATTAGEFEILLDLVDLEQSTTQ